MSAIAIRNIGYGLAAAALVVAVALGFALQRPPQPPAVGERPPAAEPPPAAVAAPAPRADPLLVEAAAQMVPPPFGTPLALQADPRRLRALMAEGEEALAASGPEVRQTEGARRIQIAAVLGYGPARRMIVRDYLRSRLVRTETPAPDVVRYALDGFTLGAARPEQATALVGLARYFVSRQELTAFATYLVEAIRDDPRLLLDRRLAPLFDALAPVVGFCAAIARTVGAIRETAECVPLLRQRVIARARRAQAVGRENEARRHALWVLEQLDSAPEPEEQPAPRPSVRILPGFHTVPAAGQTGTPAQPAR